MMYTGGFWEHAPTEDRMLQVEKYVARASALDHMAQRRHSLKGAHRNDIERHMNESINDFLGEMLSTNNEDASEEDLAPALSRRYDFNVEEFDDLPSVAVPLALVRELVARHHIIIKTSSHPNWGPFAQKYRAAIRV